MKQRLKHQTGNKLLFTNNYYPKTLIITVGTHTGASA